MMDGNDTGMAPFTLPGNFLAAAQGLPSGQALAGMAEAYRDLCEAQVAYGRAMLSIYKRMLTALFNYAPPAPEERPSIAAQHFAAMEKRG